MEETMKNSTTEQIINGAVEEEDAIEVPAEVSEDALKAVVEEEMQKIARQNLLLGGQSVCKLVLDKIITFKTKPGKPTMNDYKRLVKDIEHFCSIGLSRKVTADGETVPREEESVAEETVQN